MRAELICLDNRSIANDWPLSTRRFDTAYCKNERFRVMVEKFFRILNTGAASCGRLVFSYEKPPTRQLDAFCFYYAKVVQNNRANNRLLGFPKVGKACRISHMVLEGIWTRFYSSYYYGFVK